MSALPASSRWLGRQRIPRSTAGVGLVELMVVVVIISMLMTAAVPSYQQVQRKARVGALVNDFRVFTAVFLAHAHETGTWPAEFPAGVVPTGIAAEELKADIWTRATPIGGKFDWEFNQLHKGVKYRAAVAITSTDSAPLLIDIDMFREMDQALDDGNLDTGNFRVGDGDCPLFILEQ